MEWVFAHMADPDFEQPVVALPAGAHQCSTAIRNRTAALRQCSDLHSLHCPLGSAARYRDECYVIAELTAFDSLN